MVEDERASGSSPSLNDVFEVLGHGSRRRILSKVADKNPRTEEELEDERFVTGNEEHDRVEVELSHKHLPKLEDAGFVDWDTETGTVTRGPRFEEIEPLLALLERHSDELPDDWP